MKFNKFKLCFIVFIFNLLTTSVVLCQDYQNDKEYSVTKNIPYTEKPGVEQYLDLYWPKTVPKSTIIFIHGGSMKESGERRTSELYKNVCIPIVENGIGCATIDYRLAPENQWPAMPNDVVKSILKIRSLIEQRKGDINSIFLFGHSSGCTLAATIGSNPTFLESNGLSQKNIKGVIAMGCILDNRDASFKGIRADDIRERYISNGPVEVWPTPEDWISANPSYHISSQTSPTLVIVAKEERFAPPILEQGARFVRLLSREHKVDAELIIVPGKHYSSIRDINEKENPTFNAILKFIHNHE